MNTMPEIPDKVRDEIESLPHVVGTGIGKKRIGGQKTDETSLVVFVDRKRPETELAENERVPRTVNLDDGTTSTDVQQVGDVTTQAMVDPVDRQSERTDRYRPAPAGVSVAHPSVSAGTLGSTALETADGETVVLTNAHVAAPQEEASEGDALLQPGPADGGSEGDDIGSLSDWSEISPDEPNTTDSALVSITPDDIESEILGIGSLTGFGEPDIEGNEEYVKSGRTTGVTSGDLRSRDARIRVGGYYDERVVFEGVDVFGPMSAGGDSGSLIGIEDGEGFTATNLLFAGSDQSTIAVPMPAVEEEHGELTPLEGQGGDGGSGRGGEDGSMRFSERVRDRLEDGYGADAVEADGEDFRVAAWPLDLVVIATGDLGTGVERARKATGDAVVLAVPEGTKGEVTDIPAGIAVVSVAP